jgi:chemotaxis protein MotB
MALYKRRRRRRESDEPINHDRWLVSYADFITLLFAFFVVMYAILRLARASTA